MTLTPKTTDMEKNVNWREYFELARDTSGESLTYFENKYGRQLERPHINSATIAAKDFDDFMRLITQYEDNSGSQFALDFNSAVAPMV